MAMAAVTPSLRDFRTVLAHVQPRGVTLRRRESDKT
jgi:hypothetical protein